MMKTIKILLIILLISVITNIHFLIKYDFKDIFIKTVEYYDIKKRIAEINTYINEFYENERLNLIISNNKTDFDRWVELNDTIKAILNKHEKIFVIFYPFNYNLPDTIFYFLSRLNEYSVIIYSIFYKDQKSIKKKKSPKIFYMYLTNNTNLNDIKKPVCFFLDKNYKKSFVFTSYNCQNNMFLNYFNLILTKRLNEN